MNRSKIATLVAASFAGLMLSSPSFSADVIKAPTSTQTTASATGPQENHQTGSTKLGTESRSAESAQDKAFSSAKAEADAKAEYKAAVEKCDAQPTGQRSACVQDAEAAQTLALEQSRHVTPASGAPESRSAERADKQSAKSDASSNTAMKNQTDSNTPRKTGAPESRSTERADKRTAVSKKAAAAAKADYKAAVQKCDVLPSGERGSCMQDAEDAQSLAMTKGRAGSPPAGGAPESRIVGPQSAK